jgi:hypothetical protein
MIQKLKSLMKKSTAITTFQDSPVTEDSYDVVCCQEIPDLGSVSFND